METKTNNPLVVLDDDQNPQKKFFDFVLIDLHQWEGFWYTSRHLQFVKEHQASFEARDDDVVIASSIKTGTTWLKALCFCIINGRNGEYEEEGDDPLVKNHPTVYVQTIENRSYAGNHEFPDLASMPSPRLYHTHIPYSALPDSIKTSDCKIIYITRNPKDTLVSMWHFFSSFRKGGPCPFDLAFESFCEGYHTFGPFWDHVLEYWEESLKMPQKILFLKYEDLKRDPKGVVKKLALFLGRPFGSEEEVDRVLWRCSLERLKNLEVNKEGLTPAGLPKSSFFRLGVVGDWKNVCTQEMRERIDEITRVKLEKSGLELID